jgi:hypothetical protein
MTSVAKRKGKPTINHVRVLQSIAINQRDGTIYAPVGASYKRAMDLVNYGLATPAQGQPISGSQRFAVTRAGQSLLGALDGVAHDDKHLYWVRDKVKN